ncbi:MAG TPA: rhomboid family intramembrane serine protease [Armatimonadota bacterium]|jgi:rhomboid protease GluP
MDLNLNLLLGILTLAWSLPLLWGQAKNHFQWARGWGTKTVLCLLLLSVGYLACPDYAGYLGFGVFGLLILAPALAVKRSKYLLMKQCYGASYRWALLAQVLHPWDGTWTLACMVKALWMAFQGDLAGAEVLIRKVDGQFPAEAQFARIMMLSLSGHWEELAEWARSVSPAGVAAKHPALSLAYLRALCEAGDLNTALAAYRDLADLLAKLEFLPAASVTLLAHAGQEQAVRQLLARSPKAYSREGVESTLALAQAAAGDWASARATYESLRQSPNPVTRQHAERRLRERVPVAQQILSPEGRQALEALLLEIEQEDLYGEHDIGLAPVSSLLTTLNALVFTLAGVVAGGAYQPGLYQWGVLSPLACLYGEWYRVLSYQFLHQGLLHIGMNLMGLWYLAPFVERHLGKLRFLLLYLASGALAGLCIVYATAQGWMPVRVYLGASGSIMGLVGATAAILWRGWRRDRAPLARSRLTGVAVMVVLQVVFDHLVPRVSGEAHLLGLTWGLLLGVLLLHTLPERDPD